MPKYELTKSGFRYLSELNKIAEKAAKDLMARGIVSVKFSQDQDIQRGILSELFDAGELGGEPNFEDMLTTLRKRESFSFKETETKFNNVLYSLIKSGYISSTRLPANYIEELREKPEEELGKAKAEDLRWHTIRELRNMCQDRRLSTEGTKESLIRRLG